MKIGFLFLGILAFSGSAFAYEGQPKEIKILASIGKFETATLDEIRLDSLDHTPGTAGVVESYRPREGQNLYMTVNQVRYMLSSMQRSAGQDNSKLQLNFKEVETGARLGVVGNGANIQVLGAFLEGTVTQRY